MLDAPVSGGVLAAEAGTLTFMVWATSQQSPKGKKKFLWSGYGSFDINFYLLLFLKLSVVASIILKSNFLVLYSLWCDCSMTGNDMWMINIIYVAFICEESLIGYSNL